ncbi:MAG: hypothetical protein AB8H80_08135 [Planctomycetota bacterium]
MELEHFHPSQDPAEGLGVLMVFRLIEEALPAFFRADREIFITRAPGRLDVMGGLAGAAAPQAIAVPTAEAACVAVQLRDDELVRLWSPCRDGSRTQMLSVRLSDLGLPGQPIDFAEARAFLAGDPRDRWAGYLLGALLTLARRHALLPERGAELLLHSDVPVGCSVGSSTAITIATLQAFARLYGLELSPTEIASLAEDVEREVLGADARRSDAMVSLLGNAGELLVMRGAGADLEQRLAVPSDLEIVALGLADGAADCAADGAAAGAASSFGADASGAGASGADISAAGTPGAGEDPERTARFCELLGREPSLANRHALGDQMFEAHASYGSSGCGRDAADLVVDFLRGRREGGNGVYGAKLSGRGGGGGTVVLLGAHNKVWYEALRAKKHLSEATGHSAHVFRWSSPGAMAFGSIDLAPKSGGGKTS